MMDELKFGSEAIIVNSDEHSEWNFHKCKILSKEKDFIKVQIHEGDFVIENIKVKPNELIPILYEKKEDIEKYGNLEHLYKLFSEYKGYYDTICRIADEECSRADKLTKENQNLQCKIDEMQKHIDCMKAEIREKEDKPIFPHEPIKVAEMLICAKEKTHNLLLGEIECKSYDETELRQIAEHLLVYCNAERN